MGKVPKGYKQTKVGVIPEDWGVVKLNEISTLGTGKTPLRTNKSFWKHGTIYWATTTEVNTNHIISTHEKITEYAAEKLNLKILPVNTILLAMYGQGKTRGKVALLKIESTINQAFASIRPSEKYHTNYVFNYLIQSYTRIREMSHGSNQDNLNLDIVKSIKIPLPPLKEQEKIAQILTTWDNAIAKQEALIKAKEEQKKGLMQKLLSGEVRFNGFDDEWKEVTLGELGQTYGGLTGKTANDFGNGNSKYITYKNIFDNSKIDTSIFDVVEINSNETQNKAMYGDIFFTTSSETPEEVGMSSVLLKKVDNVYLNSFCFAYRLNDFDTLIPDFASFYFRSFYIRDKIMRLAQGSTRFNLSKSQVMKIKMNLPSLKEQEKIATVLSLSDREIEELKYKLKELKQQKTGLMQKLLTGQIRVKV